SHHVVGKWAAPGAVDPEEMLVASISTCHMLTFLHVARLAGFVITRYRDAAVGVMEKDTEGRMAVTRVTLRPEITYEGRRPAPAATPTTPRATPARRAPRPRRRCAGSTTTATATWCRPNLCTPVAEPCGIRRPRPSGAHPECLRARARPDGGQQQDVRRLQAA